MAADSLKLIAYGKVMEDDNKTLKDYSIKENDFLVVMVSKVSFCASSHIFFEGKARSQALGGCQDGGARSCSIVVVTRSPIESTSSGPCLTAIIARIRLTATCRC
jgi:hypothetical protein